MYKQHILLIESKCSGKQIDCSIYSLKSFVDINTRTLEIVRKIMQIYCLCGLSSCCYIMANIIAFGNESVSLINLKAIGCKMIATFSDPPFSETLAVHFCTSGTILGLSMLPITHSKCYKFVSPAVHNVCKIKIDP